jgi:hypothetical protein
MRPSPLLKRLASSEEIAAMVVYVCSARASARQSHCTDGKVFTQDLGKVGYMQFSGIDCIFFHGAVGYGLASFLLSSFTARKLDSKPVLDDNS